MTYIAYVALKSDHVKQLDERGNPYSMAEKIWMIVANIFIGNIYSEHPTDLVIHSSWNPDMNLTIFSPDVVRMPLVILVRSWSPPKAFFYTHNIVE